MLDLFFEVAMLVLFGSMVLGFVGAVIKLAGNPDAPESKKAVAIVVAILSLLILILYTTWVIWHLVN